MHPMKLRLWQTILCFTFAGMLSPSSARSLAPEDAHTSIKAGIEQFLRLRQPENLIRLEIEVGKIDPRLKLSACEHLENFLPPGNKEWGKLTVGVRCLRPKTWTIYVAANVRAFGDYVSTTKALAAGQQINAGDLQLAKGEISNLAPGLITDIDQALGKTLISSQAAGTSLHQAMFKLIPRIQSGQTVKIFTRGASFFASNDGIAINNAAEGQLAKARTSSGQIISGYATAAGSIEVR